MNDDVSRLGKRPEKERIRAYKPDELREWSNRLGVGTSELERIIAEVGDDPDKVRTYLNNRA